MELGQYPAARARRPARGVLQLGPTKAGEAELAYLLDAGNIPLADWNGGDHLWFIDWVAPFGKADSLS